MKIIPLQTKDLAQFKAYAKQYGVLFASIKDKSAQGEKIDIMFKAEDVSKLNRIMSSLDIPYPRRSQLTEKRRNPPPDARSDADAREDDGGY